MDKLSAFGVPSVIIDILNRYAEHPEEWKRECNRMVHPTVTVTRTDTAWILEGDEQQDPLVFTREKGVALELIWTAMRKREITGGGSLYVEMPFDATLEGLHQIKFRCDATSVVGIGNLHCTIANGMITVENRGRETVELREGQPIAKIV